MAQQSSDNTVNLRTYFQDPSMPIAHKVHWYKEFLEIISLINEKSGSKKGKKFKHAFQEHALFTMIFECFLISDAQELMGDIPRQLTEKFIPFIKNHSSALKNLAQTRMVQLLDQALIFQANEADFYDNALSFNANILVEITDFQFQIDNQELSNKLLQVRTVCSDTIIKLCDEIEHKIHQSDESLINKIWWGYIFNHHEQIIGHIWGIWRHNRLFDIFNNALKELKDCDISARIKTEEDARKIFQIAEFLKQGNREVKANTRQAQEQDDTHDSCDCDHCQ